MQNKIISAIRLGMTYERAATAAGVSVSAFMRWKQKGNAAKSGKYREFVEALKRAEAEGEAMLLQRIQTEAKNGTWQAAAWILERKHRARWGRNVDITSGGEKLPRTSTAAEDAAKIVAIRDAILDEVAMLKEVGDASK
jgi:transposase